MKRVFFKTFGCRTNIYDTNLMVSNLKDFKVVNSEKEADIIVINSCTVTNGADSSVRSYINRIKDKRVILAGCGAISRGEKLYREGKIDGVFGHSEKRNINRLLKLERNFFEIGDLNSIDEEIVEDFRGKSKAFIKIQEGCNFNCSYCIIPSVRGKARSQKEDKILREIRTLANNGYGEFVLTGTNIGSYGRDRDTSLAKLLKKIFLIKGVKRVRLGSLEPTQIDDEFKELLDEPILEKHLHIALQHTDNEMLKIMRRRNSIKNDLKLFRFLRERRFAVGTDFIVGHPGETEERWLNGLEIFKEFPLTHLHCFTFSPRDNTHSATMKNSIKGSVAKERLKILESIVKENNFNFRKENKSTPLTLLVEERKGEYQIGYDQFFNRVYLKSKEDIVKNWIVIDNYKIEREGNFAKIEE